ncbi:MAG: GT2 family glycosyltransferase [Planctomycetota bacterium]|jgi:GT2 family glycosyltransferase
MSRLTSSSSVSIVLPALDTRELFEVNLPPLIAELAQRRAGAADCEDEIIVVDDTGTGSLAKWLGGRFSEVRSVVRGENGGFARALKSGVEAARNDLVFSLNTDVLVRPGFLEPLVKVIGNPEVLAVSPRVLLNGSEDTFESWTYLALKDGLLSLERPEYAAPGQTSKAPDAEGGPCPVPFAVGGTLLFRAKEFLEGGGFDPLFEPFYLEDVDWCWEGWAQGRSILVESASVVEHNHRGTIGTRVASDVVRAAIERNRLLFLWKHLDDGALVEEHLTALSRLASDAWICDERQKLIWLKLALDDRTAALAARAQRKTPKLGFQEILDKLG